MFYILMVTIFLNIGPDNDSKKSNTKLNDKWIGYRIVEYDISYQSYQSVFLIESHI